MTDTLPFLVSMDDSGPEDTKSIFGQGREIKLRDIPMNALMANLVQVSRSLGEIFEEVNRRSPQALPLREAHVKCEVSASGGVQLVGTAEIGGSGAITLIFRA